MKYLVHKVNEVLSCIQQKGVPVLVNNQGTLEFLNHSFTLSFTDFIDIDKIESEVREYYQSNNMNYDEIKAIENEEYNRIMEGVEKTFSLFDKDINTRQAIWTSPWCISLIHFIVRMNVINCFVKFRSSDVKKLLASDLLIILKLVSKLQYKLNIKMASVFVNIDSAHIIVIDNIEELKNCE